MSKLITSTQIKRGTVSFSKRQFGGRGAKAKETRVWFYFPTAGTAAAPAPITRPHGLGRVPTSYTPVNSRSAAGAPGTVFAKFPWATRTQATLQCSTADTWVEIILR